MLRYKLGNVRAKLNPYNAMSMSAADTLAGKQRPARGNRKKHLTLWSGVNVQGSGLLHPLLEGLISYIWGNCYLNVNLGFLPLTFTLFNVLNVTK